MIRTFSVQSTDNNNLWTGILLAVAFAVQATVHTMTQATLAQLIFGQDAIFQVQHLADWRLPSVSKTQPINSNNARENSKRQRVLIKAEQSAKYGTDLYFGPFTVEAVNNSGTVRIKGTITDTYSICNVTLYTE